MKNDLIDNCFIDIQPSCQLGLSYIFLFKNFDKLLDTVDTFKRLTLDAGIVIKQMLAWHSQWR